MVYNFGHNDNRRISQEEPRSQCDKLSINWCGISAIFTIYAESYGGERADVSNISFCRIGVT